MSESDSTVLQSEPSPSRECGEAEGYRACFYPGFVRRLAVRRGTEEIVLYDQAGKPFVLPAGEEKPWPCSGVEFTDPSGREIRLQIDDRHQRIARIEVVFKKDPAEDGTTGDGDGDTLVVEDTPVVCPPDC